MTSLPKLGVPMLRTGMKRSGRSRAAALSACALMIWSTVANCPAYAQAPPPAELSRVLELITQQEQRLNAQESQLHEQQRQLSEQRALIERQRAELVAMGAGAVLTDDVLADARAAGAPSAGLDYTSLAADEPISVNRRAPIYGFQQQMAEGGASVRPVMTDPPQTPVGEAPPEQERAEVEALPEGNTALAGRGRLVIEPSIEYSRSSSNRLVFRGVEIVPGINIGLIEANDAQRDTIAASVAARYSLTDRLEVEGRVPFIYRSDRITTVAQNDDTITRVYQLEGSNVGDIEISARYQLNDGANGAPIFVAGARIKSDTGKGPFDLARDEQGVSTELATGSGFWGLQGSVSMLYPSDPVVLFANASYLYNMERDVNKDFGNAHVGNVDPGDSIGLGFGFGFSLNPRFSYSLGYSHAYVMETETEINNTIQKSTPLQVGTLQLGMSFRTTERTTLSSSIAVGVTEDAPDVSVGFRMPISF